MLHMPTPMMLTAASSPPQLIFDGRNGSSWTLAAPESVIHFALIGSGSDAAYADAEYVASAGGGALVYSAPGGQPVTLGETITVTISYTETRLEGSVTGVIARAYAGSGGGGGGGWSNGEGHIIRAGEPGGYYYDPAPNSGILGGGPGYYVGQAWSLAHPGQSLMGLAVSSTAGPAEFRFGRGAGSGWDTGLNPYPGIFPATPGGARLIWGAGRSYPAHAGDI